MANVDPIKVQVSNAAGGGANLGDDALTADNRHRRRVLEEAWHHRMGHLSGPRQTPGPETAAAAGAPDSGSSPWRAEYNPLQAGIIGAGAATQSAINQARQALYRGQQTFADRWGFQGPSEKARTALADIGRQRAEENALYEPLRVAHPYATAFGEAFPSIVGGRRALSTANQFAFWKTYANEVADAVNAAYPESATSKKLKQLANALRNF